MIVLTTDYCSALLAVSHGGAYTNFVSYLNLNLHCIALPRVGVPEPEVTVCKDGTPVQVDGSHVTLSQVDRQVVLEVRETTAADAGEYSFSAVNERGRLHHAVTVDVIPAALECVQHIQTHSIC